MMEPPDFYPWHVMEPADFYPWGGSGDQPTPLTENSWEAIQTHWTVYEDCSELSDEAWRLLLQKATEGEWK